MIEEAAHTPLAAWESFYVIVGSSGAALTGLQFVVMALISESPLKGSSTREIDAFGTPVIVHFSAVLLIAAILSSPWQGLSNVSIVLAVCGLVGIIYGLIVVNRARSQTGYAPVFEDWLWHAILPITAYTGLFISALLLRSYAQRVLFVIGSVALLLLFIGIHNSWDTVTYIAIAMRKRSSHNSETVEENEHVVSAKSPKTRKHKARR